MLGPFLCGLLTQAPLLPKLRGHFAEFLDNASPAGLRILSSSTCVGLRYGYCMNDSGFSWHTAHVLRYSLFAPRRGTGPCGGISLPAACPACAGLSSPRHMARACVPTVLPPRSTGISACCPSATPPGLALGPDSPRADQLHPGNLGYPAGGIPTPLSLLIPAFSLPAAPRALPAPLPCGSNAPLPAHLRAPRGFGGMFEPREFSARGLSTSELLRTL